MKKESVTISLDPLLKEQFKKYCNDKGFKVSTRIAILMFNDMSNNRGGE